MTSPPAGDWAEYLARGEAEGARQVLLIPREALQGQAGNRLANRTGSSIEFKDFRDYQPGDDLRRVDWSVYARSDRMIVKLFHDEVNPHLDLVLDLSASMSLPETPKPGATFGLAALLAMAAENGRCSRRIWTLKDKVDELQQSDGPPSTWLGLDFAASPTTPNLVTRYGRNSIRVLISDLMWDVEPREALRPLAAGAARLVVIQLLATEDQEPVVSGHTRLIDRETGAVMELVLDTLAVQRYSETLARHRAQWQEACRAMGALLVPLTAEAFLKTWRIAELEAAGLLGSA